ncbi:MAG: hypothetical protein LC624_01085 [Halobacteriales archaeon]|nr:hypothetical protein [Halobacteriales archaeon]
MAARKLTAVCRDCGEVMHVDLTLVKPGSPVACPGCGLFASNLPALPQPGRPGPSTTRAAPARAGARAR